MDSSLSAPATGRRELQKHARERRILSAARRLFDRKGYAKTSMEDVADRAGLAVGTLYNYFHSKDHLLLGIMRREADGLLPRTLTAGEQSCLQMRGTRFTKARGSTPTIRRQSNALVHRSYYGVRAM